jgi:hypothetical protein
MTMSRGFPANNTEKLSSALYKAQLRAKIRTVSTATVQKKLREVYLTLQQRLYKKDIVGLVVSFDAHARLFPLSYKYCPRSTVVTARRTTRGWSIIDVARERTQEKEFVASGLQRRHEALARHAIKNWLN